ncbi:hypothetical protein Cpir12675_006434 [Ceratocystis pirilliformis]|uniref:Peptidase M13 C-terminal domain-containing protein n=1 Tax=Ceratocystis pirilliformis TaxID=259994 RepID=A0ABR3YI78_9PEZI
MSNGVDTLLSLESHVDFHSPNSHILGVSAPSSLGLPSKRYYDNEDILGEYGDVIAHILRTLYPDLPECARWTTMLAIPSLTSRMSKAQMKTGNWESLTEPGEPSEWREKMTTPLCNYHPEINRLVLTASLLQPPFFGTEIPGYISYGSVGFITAREMSHAFWSLGRHYDREYHFRSWWSEQTLQGFNDKAQCFIDEYSKLTVPDYTGEDFHINGTSTLEENISDFYGLSMAYNAWAKYSKGSNANPLLPGLDFFTRDQLFFVSFGSLWCSKSTSESMLDEAIGGKYTPLGLRSNAVVLHSREYIRMGY